MSYTIFHKETTVIFGKRFATERAAKAGLTRAVKSGKIVNRDHYSIEESIYFANFIEKTRVVKNLMSGKDVTISVNCPLSCDPSSETYWSM